MKYEITYCIEDSIYIHNESYQFVFDSEQLMDDDQWAETCEAERSDIINDITAEHFRDQISFNIKKVKEIK